MLPILRVLFVGVACGTFALATLLLMAHVLPAQDVRDGAWIFALAFLAVFIGIAAFARGNAHWIEHFARHRDRRSLRAMLWRGRR